MRINRYLAVAGFGSRRACEELVRTGKVTVNGRRCEDLATEIAPTDHVKVGARLARAERPLYVLLHKPRGYLCTASDERGRKTIFDLLPKDWPRLFHVGRLDKDSEGLLILTNDGGFAQKMSHPSHGLEKEYLVVLDRAFDPAKIEKLLRGIVLEQGRAKADRVRQLAPDELSIVLKQGLKRQIREMLYRVGYDVKRLARIRIGPLRDRGLTPGKWRLLTPKEIAALASAAATPATPTRRQASTPSAGASTDGKYGGSGSTKFPGKGRTRS